MINKVDEFYICNNFALALKLQGIIDDEQFDKAFELLKKTYGKYLKEEENNESI